MTPAEVCRAVHAAGLTVRVDGDSLVIKPADRLTSALREMLVAHKPELIQFLREAEQTAAELLDAAMRACDHFQDSPEMREKMRQDLLQVPAHAQPELLEHFRREYGWRRGKKSGT